MVKKYFKKCSLSLADRKMQTETTLRFHPTPGRMANLNKTTDNKGWESCGESRTLNNFGWECKLMESRWTSVTKIIRLSQPTNDPLYDSWVYT